MKFWDKFVRLLFHRQVATQTKNRGKWFVRVIVNDILIKQGHLVTDTKRVRKKKSDTAPEKVITCNPENPVEKETLIGKLGGLFK